MGRYKKSRSPVGHGGTKNLQPKYQADRESSRDGAERTLRALLDAGLPVNEKNWEKTRKSLKPKGCSWRTTYRSHCHDLMAPYRDVPEQKSTVSASLYEAAQAEVQKVIAIVGERDAEIGRLRDRILVLEDENRKLSRGTRSRRRRKPLIQGRQSGNGDAGSD